METTTDLAEVKVTPISDTLSMPNHSVACDTKGEVTSAIDRWHPKSGNKSLLHHARFFGMLANDSHIALLFYRSRCKFVVLCTVFVFI